MGSIIAQAVGFVGAIGSGVVTSNVLWTYFPKGAKWSTMIMYGIGVAAISSVVEGKVEEHLTNQTNQVFTTIANAKRATTDVEVKEANKA